PYQWPPPCFPRRQTVREAVLGGNHRVLHITATTDAGGIGTGTTATPDAGPAGKRKPKAKSMSNPDTAKPAM
ncbi:MAG: hypothetical protein ACT4TC_03705, partial [Myxococcaceae bacterium]